MRTGVGNRNRVHEVLSRRRPLTLKMIWRLLCPNQGTGAALILPTCNTEAMNLHLAEISKMVAPKAHALLLVDQAGWHLSARLVVPPISPFSPAAEIPWTQSGREHLAVHARQLALETASSNPTTISSTTAAMHGTSSSTSLEDHVHRIAPTAHGLIKGTWYKASEQLKKALDLAPDSELAEQIRTALKKIGSQSAPCAIQLVRQRAGGRIPGSWARWPWRSWGWWRVSAAGFILMFQKQG
jgi:hypothetical protein